MARKPKGYYTYDYDWSPVLEDYLAGESISFLVEKYGIARSTMENKIRHSQWASMKKVSKTVDKFESVAKRLGDELKQNNVSDKDKANIFERVNTVVNDNLIQSSNRTIAIQIQNHLVKLLNDIKNEVADELDPKGLLALTQSIKNLEQIVTSGGSSNIVNIENKVESIEVKFV